MTPRREIRRAMAEVIHGRDAVEQLVLRFRELEGHLFGELEEPLEDVKLVREGRREGQHPSW